MKNHKQLLADFYLELLAIPLDNRFRLLNQNLYSSVLFSLARELDEGRDIVQRIFERMVEEDKEWKMRHDNPACYECPKGKNKLHTWSSIIENEINRVGAICLHCNIILTKSQADDVWKE